MLLGLKYLLFSLGLLAVHYDQSKVRILSGDVVE